MTAVRRATSLAVAKRAGVSRSTVSLVLNGVPGVSFNPETRSKVLRAAEELGYVPNAAAQSLVSGQSRTIGLVVSQAEHLQVDAFIAQVLFSLSRASQQEGYRVLLETVEDISKPDAYTHLVRGQHIDGLIVLNTRSDDAQLPELIQRNFPMVLMGFPSRLRLDAQTHVVETDGRSAARRATNHLIGLGHIHIAHITFSPQQYYATQDRYEGYRSALGEAGLRLDSRLVRYGNYSAESGYTAMQDLLNQKRLPTALFAGNDTIAIGAMAAIHQRGLRIPEDIAVVGYDDIPTAPYTVPPLTTIRTSAVQHGQLAVQRLSQLIRGESPSEHRVSLETPLIVRESCGAKRAGRTANSPRA
jgi:DNA-binding LacI/PurR family transcriptional regulator